MGERARERVNEVRERERERDGGMQGEDVIIMFTVSLRTQEMENRPVVDKRCVEMLNLLNIKGAFYRFYTLKISLS